MLNDNGTRNTGFHAVIIDLPNVTMVFEFMRILKITLIYHCKGMKKKSF